MEQKQINQQDLQALSDAINKAIGKNDAGDKFIDLSKIPLICLSMAHLSSDMKEIKRMIKENKEDSDKQHATFVTKAGEFWAIRTIVFGGAGIVLVAFLNSVLNK